MEILEQEGTHSAYVQIGSYATDYYFYSVAER